MYNENCAPTTTTATTKTKKKEMISNKDGTITSLLFGKGKYKLWVLAAILLLSLCSIFTGTVTLKWSSSSSSSGTLSRFSDDSLILDDLDVLEIEEREKVVKHMWEVYTQSHRIRLPKFWKDAFEAAYEDLISDIPDIRRAAISEIAKMSIRRRSMIDLDNDAPSHRPLQSTKNAQGANKSRMEEAKGGVGKNKVPSNTSSQ